MSTKSMANVLSVPLVSQEKATNDRHHDDNAATNRFTSDRPLVHPRPNISTHQLDKWTSAIFGASPHLDLTPSERGSIAASGTAS